jgi:hypothetical protein
MAGSLVIQLCLFPSVAKRPPVEETASFLQSLLASHGPNYLEKLFGSKARDALAPLGGVEKVAIALSGKLKPRSLGCNAPRTVSSFKQEG